MRRGTYLRLIPLVVLAAIAGLFFALGLNRYVTVLALRDNATALNGLVAVHPILSSTAFVCIYVLVVTLSIPGGAVMTMSSGFFFGLWTGSLLSMIAATSGAVAVFLIARFAAGDVLHARAGRFIARTAMGLQRNAFTYLLFLRLVPLIPFWAVNLAPAVLGVPLQPFVTATAIGIIPDTLAYASVGNSLDRYFQAGARVPLGKIFSPGMIAVRLGLAALALLPIGLRVLRHPKLAAWPSLRSRRRHSRPRNGRGFRQ